MNLDIDLNNKIKELLRKIDLNTLQNLAGETVVKAVNSVFSSNVESELAEIVHLRYGNELLSNKSVRDAIFDVLNENEIGKLCGDIKDFLNKL